MTNSLQTSDFPDPVKAILHLASEKPLGEASQVLVHCLASAVHPDFLCNVATLATLPTSHRAAALELLTYCLTTGLTVQQRCALLQIVQPLMLQMFGPGSRSA